MTEREIERRAAPVLQMLAALGTAAYMLLTYEALALRLSFPEVIVSRFPTLRPALAQWDAGVVSVLNPLNPIAAHVLALCLIPLIGVFFIIATRKRP